MKLARRIESFSGLSAEVKKCIKWVRRRLNNGGNQYDIRSHLEARNKATEVTRQSPSLLGQFLSQTEPPQRCIQPGESDELETDSDGGWFGSESEEEEMPESDDLAILWAQREGVVYLTINLHDVQNSAIDLQAGSIDFKNTTEGMEYAFNLSFYAPVKVDESKKSITGRYAFLVLAKAEEAWWPRLTNENVRLNFVKVDFERWADEDDSDDEPNLPGGMDFSQFGMPGGGGLPNMNFDMPALGADGGDDNDDHSDAADDATDEVDGEEADDAPEELR
ncbi:mitochondrial carrier [Purpureocillium lavendulum]|uniref:Mitochondrial carrier n=1 Tax=Purpureocillium lavendulum TaxID=1247861 RepID=A0AB34FEU8_9HYPO|nr:mitochondrial carrier [Purpureocillium lavendulum]